MQAKAAYIVFLSGNRQGGGLAHSRQLNIQPKDGEATRVSESLPADRLRLQWSCCFVFGRRTMVVVQKHRPVVPPPTDYNVRRDLV